ncbi:MAG: thioredoxin domain-containing protein [Anaerolineae bacterium]|nr:thioredoxin domain-containing protein [Anaerolineae bacterium]
MPNRLLTESSPYLQQHAHNPVDWYPWGEEAFAKAKAEQKLVFLSIGYSTCHWCHVMAHESFEDAAVAQILNTHFVSIKVDREERPDLDAVYMGAVHAITGSGGWPLSVFLTPDKQPFYGGTYFPKEPRYGMPSFTQVLLAIVEAWDERREDLLASGEQIRDMLQRQQGLPTTGDTSAEKASDRVEHAHRVLRQQFDAVNGGWGSAPKFPQPMALEFLLRYHHATGDPAALSMVTQTLEAMARGGIFDQIGGGFHRYTVDANWLTPHFERMLYDNAQLARVYLHAWQMTENPLFRAITEEVLDYIQREMTDSAGGFYAAQDADSEGEEGRFYLWTPAEIQAVFGGPTSRFMALYSVTETGNFEGKNILTFNGTFEEREALTAARRWLFAAREQRPHPHRDEKVLTAWNGLMLAAFAEAAWILERDDYRHIAERNAQFLLDALRTNEGRLWRTWKDGHTQIPGFLGDYANLSEGLLALYQATFDPQWYHAAHELAEIMLAHFSADAVASAGFYDTADDAESLVVRPRGTQDNATPSGNAMAATVLLKLARLSSKPHYAEVAQRSLASMGDVVAQHPLSFAQWLIALESTLASPTEIAIVGDLQAADTQALLQATGKSYHPHRLIVVGTDETLPLLQNRPKIDGQATAYLCVNATCHPPIVDPEAL